MTDLIDEEYFDDENDELLNANSEQCFLFFCNDILYAIPALNVNEIIEYQSITKIPLINSCVLGVTNIEAQLLV